MTRVFVYGTLKSGHGNNRLLHDATMVGRTVIYTPHKLFCLGGFPGLVRTRIPQGLSGTEHHQVGGEVWEVNDEQLARLDRLEGYPDFYQREEVSTPLGVAWTYTLPDTPRYMSRPVETVFWRETPEEQQAALDYAAWITAEAGAGSQ